MTNYSEFNQNFKLSNKHCKELVASSIDNNIIRLKSKQTIELLELQGQANQKYNHFIITGLKQKNKGSDTKEQKLC